MAYLKKKIFKSVVYVLPPATYFPGVINAGVSMCLSSFPIAVMRRLDQGNF